MVPDMVPGQKSNDQSQQDGPRWSAGFSRNAGNTADHEYIVPGGNSREVAA